MALCQVEWLRVSQLFYRISQIVKDRGGWATAWKTGLSRPWATVRAIRRVAGSDWRTLITRSESQAKSLLTEFKESGSLDTLNCRLSAEFASLSGVKIRGKAAVAGSIRSLHAEMLWLLVRARKPQIVVETGVCNGLSSAVLLEALAANGFGKLVSVDLPEFTDPTLNSAPVWEGKGGAAVPAGRLPGWLVREELRQLWRLELGRSQDLLLPLLQELRPIDLFIHDSEHSYDNQLFEFREGYRALCSGGVLVATDITWSKAFQHFWDEIEETGSRRAFIDPSCAIVVKS